MVMVLKETYLNRIRFARGCFGKFIYCAEEGCGYGSVKNNALREESAL